MVKGWIGAAGRGFVGAAPLFEPGPLPGNWAYPDVPGMQPLLDQGDLTLSAPTGFGRGAGKWAYGQEITTEPLLDQGAISAYSRPTSFAHGHNKKPFNACARGLAKRTDAKIKKPWLWP